MPLWAGIAETGRMWWTQLLSLAALAAGVDAVKRETFKTCTQSGFCARQRAYKANSAGWEVQAVEETERKVRLTVQGGSGSDSGGAKPIVTLQVYAGGIVRVQADEPERQPPRYALPSNDIVLDKDLSALQLRRSSGNDDGPSITYEADGGVSVEISRRPFAVRVIVDGRTRAELNGAGLFNWESDRTPKGESFDKWTDPQPYGLQSLAADIGFPGATHLVGLPEHASALSLAATRSRTQLQDGQSATRYAEPFRMYNLDVFEYELDSPMALYGAIPVMMAMEAGRADSAVGIFWNNPSETWIDILDGQELLRGGAADAGRTAHFMSESGVMDLFVFVGPTADTVLRQYYQVTGLPQLPPLFSIAYHQCRWNYVDEEDVLEVSRNFDEHEIPADVVWLDIEHTDGKRYFTWNKELFPDPVKMQEALVGRKLVVIVDPHMKQDGAYALYAQLQEDPKLAVQTTGGEIFGGHCWPDQSVWPDFVNPLTRIWWRKQFVLGAHAGYTNKTFIWNDMNEPSVFSGPEVTMPKELRHLEGAVEHRDVHNVYGHYMHRATYEGLLARSEGRVRPFVLTRSFYAGSQRYAAAWTGDNKACWQHLKASVPMLLSLGVAGMPFVGADVGGFFGNPDGELLLRWYQLGALQPFFRAHAHIETKRREPWLSDEPFRSGIRAAIRLRYRLLPYIYTLFRLASKGGRPVNRPMFMEFPAAADLVAVDDQFMLGGALLVKPVTEAAVAKTVVRLPRDVTWYDYHTLQRVAPPAEEEGGAAAVGYEAEADLSRIPIFVKGGSVIVRKDRLRRSSEMMQHDPHTLLIALDEGMSAKGAFYADDGTTFEYQAGAYVETRISVVDGVVSCKPAHVPAGKGVFRVGEVEKIIVAGLRGAPKAVVATRAGEERLMEFTFADTVLTVKAISCGILLTDPTWSVRIVKY